jgi:Tfp pilus assembly protein PilX
MTLPESARRGGQRGDVMLITLVLLLLLAMSLLVGLRDGLTNQWLAGNNLARQKDVHASDIALRMLESQIVSASAGMPLEIAAAGQGWYRDVAAGTAAPSASYWSNCAGNSIAASRCGTFNLAVNGTALPYTAYAVVQPTGRTDSTSCNLAQYQAIYYDLFVHVQESGGATAITTETVYRICTTS